MSASSSKGRRPSPVLKPVPRFQTEAEEREFWSAHDATEYVDWANADFVTLPRLRPSTTTISLRLPASLLNELKVLANERDVPYQSLLKIYLAERVQAERRQKAG
jgi:predicted DNA binding CopG/RHH family protein